MIQEYILSVSIAFNIIFLFLIWQYEIHLKSALEKGPLIEEKLK